ncbi:MAG: hypothetical protein ABIP54_05025 [Candidatus Andersenbacteria bacterium]
MMVLAQILSYIKIASSSDYFWQATFWGILGAITGIIGAMAGAIGFVVSWLSFRYNIPKIEVETAILLLPGDWLISRSKTESDHDLKNSILEFELEISVRNKRGGSGAIDKPTLIIQTPIRKKWFQLLRSLVIKPITQHQESEQVSENTSNIWTVRHGRSFNVAGGEKIDDRLKYRLRGEDRFEDIRLVANNFQKLKYFIKYRDNRGRLHRDMIREFAHLN